MPLVLALMLAILWIGGFVVFHLGAIVHLLLVLAIIVLVLHLLGIGTRRTMA